MVLGLSSFPGQAGSTELVQKAGCLIRWSSTGSRSLKQPDSNDAECKSSSKFVGTGDVLPFVFMFTHFSEALLISDK